MICLDSQIKKYYKLIDIFKNYIKIFKFYQNSSFNIATAAPSSISIGKQ